MIMQNNATNNKGIANSWSLISFAKAHGNMKLGNFVNKETGETFKACAFVDPANADKVTFVSFSSNLGELTAAQIAAQKDNLQVVELESGSHILCKKGQNAWEDINLF